MPEVQKVRKIAMKNWVCLQQLRQILYCNQTPQLGIGSATISTKNFNQANMVAVAMDFKGGNQRRLQVFERCLR